MMDVDNFDCLNDELGEAAELAATAYHEAAHFAVLYRLAPSLVGAVTIVPTAEWVGATFHAPISRFPDDVAGVMYFAGFWGEVFAGVSQTKARVGALKIGSSGRPRADT